MTPSTWKFRLTAELKELLNGSLMLVFHICLIGFANWVVDRNAPPNVSPDAGQPWMDRHYVPAYPDKSHGYAVEILLAGNAMTAVVYLYFYFLKQRDFPVVWRVRFIWLFLLIIEFFLSWFMVPELSARA